jgi:hypothetical protein
MSFTDCLKGNYESGLITQRQFSMLKNEYEGLIEKFVENGNTKVDSASAAADAMMLAKMDKTIKNKIALGLHAIKMGEVTDKINNAPAGVKKSTVYNDTLEEAYARGDSVASYHLGQLGGMIEKFRANILGRSGEVQLFKDVTRALLGGGGEGVAKDIAEAIRKTMDSTQNMYKSKGGVLGYIDNYFPQVHDHMKFGKVDFNTWLAEIKPKLDINKMLDFDTGLPFTEANLDKFLEGIFADIKSNGMKSFRDAMDGKKSAYGGGDMFTRRQAMRVLQFKDADSFLEYNAKYGVGDAGLFDAFINNITSMSRDIGIMDTLGPKSDLLNDSIIAGLRKTEGEKGLRVDHSDAMYKTLSGFTAGGEKPTWYNLLLGVKNLLRGSLLGSASVSAISDSAFVGSAAARHGLPVAKALSSYAKNLTTLGKDGEFIARNGAHIAEFVSQGMVNSGRLFEGDLAASGKFSTSMQVFAGFTHRASGLEHMTNAAADAASATLYSEIALLNRNKTKWSDIDPLMKEAASAAGVTEKHWNIMLKASPHVTAGKGSSFLTPKEIASVAGVDADDAIDAAIRFGSWESQYRGITTNSPSLKIRGATTLGQQTHSLPRAVIGSMLMFKSFPIGVVINHLLPVAFHKNTSGMSKFLHLGSLFTATTVLGGVALQLKDYTKGKEPRDWDEMDKEQRGKFAIAAAAQGGGIGIFADVLFQDYNRFGHNIATTAAGPVAGFANDILKTTVGNAFTAAMQDDFEWSQSMAEDTLKLFQRYNPVPGAKLWYTGAVLDRMIYDGAMRMADPQFDQRAAQMQNRLYRQTGQEYLLPPGASPSETLDRLQEHYTPF